MTPLLSRGAASLLAALAAAELRGLDWIKASREFGPHSIEELAGESPQLAILWAGRAYITSEGARHFLDTVNT